jgi:hypothetical protein
MNGYYLKINILSVYVNLWLVFPFLFIKKYLDTLKVSVQLAIFSCIISVNTLDLRSLGLTLLSRLTRFIPARKSEIMAVGIRRCNFLSAEADFADKRRSFGLYSLLAD